MENIVIEKDKLSHAITQTVSESLLILNKDLKVIFANRSFYKTFKVTPKETEGKLIYRLSNGQWNISQLRTLLGKILRKKSFFENFEVIDDFPAIGRKVMLLSARGLRKRTNQEPVILLKIEDITKQKKLENELANYTTGLEQKIAERTRNLAIRQAQYEAILESMGAGLIVIVDVDKGGKIIYVNKAFEEMLGWKAREVLNKYVVDILPREDKDGNIVPFKDRIVTHVLSGEKVIADINEPFFYVRRDKSKFPVASVITPVLVEGKIFGAVETFRDITKESMADKVKTEFASLVSHQLRSPFSTINWYSELLLSKDAGELNAKQIRYLQEIDRASKRMVTLINVLLSISRIEMGITPSEKKSIDIVTLAETILKEMEQEIQKKRLKIHKTYDKNIPQIEVDQEQLAMVFQNLFSNAIKYTPAGGKINLRIKFKRDSIIFTVTDTGIGIPQDAQSNIFTRFFRADNAKAQESEGTGLGLYIIKTVIDQMGGRIWFKSQENKGTTFYVTFPVIAISSNDDGKGGKTKTINVKMRDKTILVLEDEKSLLKAITSKLTSEGFGVVIARSADQALHHLKKRADIDLVWVDHYLSGKESGLDFVTALKHHESWKNLPVFVISNTVSPDKAQAYLTLGVQKCYTKVDYRLDQIIAEIKQFLDK